MGITCTELLHGGTIQMKYIDRKGNITIEENEQDKFLRHLYNDRGGRLCLKLLIRPFVSKAAGVLLNTRLSARFVPDFVKNMPSFTIGYAVRIEHVV